MTQLDKLITRLLSRPADFTWSELTRVLKHFGYYEMQKGKTGGSRRKYVGSGNSIIILHKPHPGNILKRYQLEQVIEVLINKGKL